MKRTVLLLCSLFSLRGIFAQQESLLKHIPSGAMEIMRIDPVRLNSLMKWEEVTKLSLFNELGKPELHNEALMEVLKNPSVTGIDLKQPLYTFTKKEVGEGEREGYRGAAGSIANLQQFTAWLLRLSNTIVLTRPGRVKTLVKGDMTYIWDTEHFVIVKDHLHHLRNMMRKVPGTGHEFRIAAPIAAQIEKSFRENLPVAAPDERLLALFREPEAIVLWQQKERMRGQMGVLLNPFRSLAQSASSASSVSASVIRFTNGHATISSRTWLEDGAYKDIFSNLQKTPFNAALLNRLNLQQGVGFITVKLDMAKMQALFNLWPKKEELLSDIQRKNLQPEDIFNGFSGDLLVMMTRMENTTTRKIKPELLFVFGISDSAAFSRAQQSLLPPILEENRDGKPAFATDPAGKFFVIGSNRADVDAYLQGTAADNDKELLAAITQNPFTLRFDIHKFVTPIIAETENRNELAGKEAIFISGLESVEQFSITSGRYENGAMLGNLDLQFANKEDNGLRLMAYAIDKVVTTLQTARKEGRSRTITMPREEVLAPDAGGERYPIPPPDAMSSDTSVYVSPNDAARIEAAKAAVEAAKAAIAPAKTNTRNAGKRSTRKKIKS